VTDLHADELTANIPWRAVAVALASALIALGLTFGAGYWQGIKHQSNAAEQAEVRANVAKGEADALKRQANAKDAEIAAKDSGLAEARADVARKVEALRSIRAHVHVSGTADESEQPILAGPEYLEPNLAGNGIIAAQDALIQSQAYLIKSQEVKISDLLISRDLWKSSAEAREREAAGLRIALEARKSLTKGALWRGRFQGIAVGAALGYAGGRLK